jgi:hypothetical protein
MTVCLLLARSAAAGTCDRGCLQGLADKLVASIVAHDVTRLPLAQTYAATEDSAPSAVGMMTLWRTVTASRDSYYVIDPVSEQVFLISTISEGSNDALLYGRMKVEANLISELELYTNRSRGQSGFQFSPAGRANFPVAWTMDIAPERRASRAELLQAGRSIFDTTVAAPAIAPGCVLMENGKVVAENAKVAQSVSPDTPGAKPTIVTNPDGTVPIPCGNPPIRPTDKHARTTIVDEQQGVVVSQAIVHGVVEPYLETNPAESAFVPYSLLAPFAAMLKEQRQSGQYHLASVRPMPATQAVAQLHRIFDGKLQGMMMLQSTGAPGSHSPWAATK